MPDHQPMAFTSIVECSDGSFYVGSTRHLDTRMNQHAVGAVRGHTAKHRPVRQVWFHETERIDQAFALEKRSQEWRRDKKIALIEGRFQDLPGLAHTRRGEREATD